MKILVANGDDLNKTTWLELPIQGFQGMNDAIRQLTTLAVGQQTEYPLCLVGADFPVVGLEAVLIGMEGKADIEQLSLLSQKIAPMTDTDLLKFSGAVKMNAIASMAEIMEIADGLDEYELIADVPNEKALGVHLVEHGYVPIPGEALPYLDHAKVGAQYFAEHNCAYAGDALIVKREVGQNQAAIFEMQITSPHFIAADLPPVNLTLPATEEKLQLLSKRLHLDDINGCEIKQSRCTVAYLDDLIPQHSDIATLNRLADEIEYLSHTDGQIIKLCAVLEAEGAQAVGRILDIALDLDDYEHIKEATHQADYGQYVLYAAHNRHDEFEFKEEVKDFIDYEEYGKYRMEEDGVRQTEFGMVRRLSEPFPEQTAGQGMNMQ